jgi:outer membrane protein assembly factor BamB
LVLVFSLVLAAAGVSYADTPTGALNAGSVRRLAPLWTSPAAPGEHQIGGAAIAGGVLWRTETTYVSEGHSDAGIARFDAATGAPLGTVVTATDRAFTQLAVDGDRLLVQGRDTVTGKSGLWSYTMNGFPHWHVDGGWSFVVGDGVVVSTGDDRVRGLDATDGHLLWQTAGASAVIADGRVIIDGAELRAVDARTGAVAWTAAGRGVPAASSSLAYLVGAAGTCAFDLVDGRRRWCDGTPGVAATALGDVVYVVGDGLVSAYSADGTVMWRRSYADGSRESTTLWTPVAGAGVMYFMAYHFDPGQRHELIALAADSGQIRKRLPVDLPWEVGGEPLLLTGERVYFAGLPAVYAFGPRPVL